MGNAVRFYNKIIIEILDLPDTQFIKLIKTKLTQKEYYKVSYDDDKVVLEVIKVFSKTAIKCYVQFI